MFNTLDFKPCTIFFAFQTPASFKITHKLCSVYNSCGNFCCTLKYQLPLLFAFFPRKALLKKKQRLNFLKLLSSLNSKEKEKKKLLCRDKKKYSYKRAFKNKVSVKLLVTTILNFLSTCLFINIDHMVKRNTENVLIFFFVFSLEQSS